ncbi:hypothetical protein [Streptomyces sp. NPDC093149]|uniref:hypothetical protein n=1 Tax=Streptomyces sp. NPDC093149 TaxID=3366031 RepID=UPI00382863B0
MIALVVVPRAAIDAHAVPWVSTDYGCWPLLVLAATGAALTWRSGSRGVREWGAMILASPPLLAHTYTTARGETAVVACLAAVSTATAAITFLARHLGRTGRTFL